MNAAQNLTPTHPPLRKPIVAIDGPAGAGKTTIAHHLARHFGLLNLETGAMYRAFALKALRNEIPLDQAAPLERLAHETSIRLDPGDEENRVLLDDEDVTGLIRNPTVTDAASRVSIFPTIRAWMVGLQQELGACGGVVMEGRDIGTVVFPHAEVKIFLDAAPEVRGQRRFEQIGRNAAAHVPPRPPLPCDAPPPLGSDPDSPAALSSSPQAPPEIDGPSPPPESETAPRWGGKSASPAWQEILRDLRARDERDRNRANSPLKPAPDAVVLDSTNLSLEEAVAAAEAIVNAKLGQTNPSA